MDSKFKRDLSFEIRKEECQRILAKFPDRIPVIVEKDIKSQIADIDRRKYLVPEDITIGQFMHVLRKRIKLNPETGMFLFINNRLPLISELIKNVYYEEKDEDGFLYVKYSGESVFGCCKKKHLEAEIVFDLDRKIHNVENLENMGKVASEIVVLVADKDKYDTPSRKRIENLVQEVARRNSLLKKRKH